MIQEIIETQQQLDEKNIDQSEVEADEEFEKQLTLFKQKIEVNHKLPTRLKPNCSSDWVKQIQNRL